MYDCVILCRGLQNEVVDVDVVEEFDSRPDTPPVFNVMMGEVQKIRTCKMPKPLPTASGGRLSGGKEVEEEKVSSDHKVN